jgi:hypothetical protein
MTKLLALAGIALLWAVPTAAHHSFAAEFDQNQPVTLKGKLTQMEWLNPHGWLHIDVAGPDGKVVNWAIEAGGPNALVRRGLRKTDFPIGSEVVVEGYSRQEWIADGQRHEREIRRRPELFPGASDPHRALLLDNTGQRQGASCMTTRLISELSLRRWPSRRSRRPQGQPPRTADGKT